MAMNYPELRLIALDGEDSYILTANDYYRNVWGDEGNDTITGNAFDNVLNGDAGADSLIGGAGNDTYRVDDPGDTIIEDSDGGIDTVYSTIDYDMAPNVEFLVLDEIPGDLNAIDGIDGYGNALSNVITGNSQNNFFEGKGGNDTIFGGAGDDTLLGGDATYVGEGNDYLDGGIGNDTMDGGIGNDTYVVDSVGDVVVESELENQGIDTVRSSVNFSAETSPYLENITLTGTAAINATGNGGNNTLIGNTAANQLFGNGGNDILNGAAGADTMDGGIGNDTYYVDNAGDRVIETSTGGTDRVYTAVSHTLANYVENLYAAGSSSINLVGNSLANTIYGNSGGNKINGGAGSDYLKGGAGKDTFYLTTSLSSSNVDKILDFSVADDSFRLDNAIFKKLGSGTDSSPKKLSSSFFTIGTKAQDSNDYLIYNNKTGYLYYDADGSGSGKAVLIATLSKNLKMTYSDFYVM